jgi:hypothetical protein
VSALTGAALEHEERRVQFAAEAARLEARAARIGNLRGLSFVVGAAGVGVYALDAQVGGLLLASLALGAFVWLIRHHDVVLARCGDATRRALVAEYGVRRCTGRSGELPDDGADLLPAAHPYARDLDLLGPGSLFQHLSVAHTRYGRARLAAWLLGRASLKEITARQAAVRELAGLPRLRQELEAEALALAPPRAKERRLPVEGPDPARLLAWVASGPNLPAPPLVTGLALLLPCATIAGLVAQLGFGLHPALWATPLLAGLALLHLTRAATSAAFAAVSTTEGAFLRYGRLLAELETLRPQAQWLRERAARLGDARGRRPSAVMRRFARLVGWYELRHSGMVYPFVNALLLWDLHATRALLAWRADVGAELAGWFEVLGDVEAASSLAGLLADDPSACLPEVLAPEPSAALEAVGLGHPLLAFERRVPCDVEPLGQGQALLVTGSNMSGKSTFLRTLGVSAVLAYAGGPVSAKRLRLPLASLGTSLRVEDSLSRGVSHFYAEVQRLADVVARAASEPPLLFLLDEVLHGTNSRERQVGARWVLSELLARGALGVVTTHDMELCRLPEPLMSRVRQHHFREEVRKLTGGAEEMTFDYVLREGPVRSGNALRLMRHVGLGVPLEE